MNIAMILVCVSLFCSVAFPLALYVHAMRRIERNEKTEVEQIESFIEDSLRVIKLNDKRRAQQLRARIETKIDETQKELGYYPPNGNAISELSKLSLPDECAANGSTGHNFIITQQPYPHAPTIQCEWCGVDFDE